MTTKTKRARRGPVLTPSAPNVPVSDALSRGLQRVAQDLAALAAGIVGAESPPDAEPRPERVQVPPREPSAPARVSKIERQVLAMHARGKSNPEIAAATGLRDRDVSAVVRKHGLKAHRKPLPAMTPDEAQKIQRLAKAGKTVQDIARETGRPEGTVFLLLHGHHRLSAKPEKKAAAKRKVAPKAKAAEAPKATE